MNRKYHALQILVFLYCVTACVAQTDLGDLRETNRIAESESGKTAERIRLEAAKPAPNAAILSNLNAELNTTVTRAFETRQAIQKSKVNKARTDLSVVEQRINQRDKNANKIIAQRMRELTDLESSWDPGSIPRSIEPNSERHNPRHFEQLFSQLAGPLTIEATTDGLRIEARGLGDVNRTIAAINRFDQSLMIQRPVGPEPSLIVKGSATEIANVMEVISQTESETRHNITRETFDLIVKSKDELLRELRVKEEAHFNFIKQSPSNEASAKRLQQQIDDVETKIYQNRLDIVSLEVKKKTVADLARGGGNKIEVAARLLLSDFPRPSEQESIAYVELALETLDAQKAALENEVKVFHQLVKTNQTELQKAESNIAQREALKADLKRTQLLLNAVVIRIDEINVSRDQAKPRILWVD